MKRDVHKAASELDAAQKALHQANELFRTYDEQIKQVSGSWNRLRAKPNTVEVENKNL